MTQDQLAALSGVAQPIISRLEGGKESNPTLDIARRLARVLGVSIDYLVEAWDVEESPTA
jgi:transcriptional regulator with XRE-family HTH domain